MSGDELARLTEEIGGLSRAGLPMPSGMLALAEELPRGKLRDVLNRLAVALESGMPLDAALKAQGNRLPAHLRGLVAAAARTGKLGEVLGRFAGYANVGIDLRRSLWLRLLSPIFSLVFASLIFLFVCVVLVNGFSKIFADFGMALPTVTRLALAVASAVARVWWPLLQGLLFLSALVLVAALVLRADVRRGMAWAIPLFGPVWHFCDLAEFAHLLGLLLESEVPLPEALTMAGQGVCNNVIAASTRTAAREVAEGQSLAETLGRRTLFPPGFARILAWAENHRSLPEALHMAGEMFEARARTQARFVSAVCSTLAVLSILGGVVTIFLAVLVPMISLIHKLSG